MLSTLLELLGVALLALCVGLFDIRLAPGVIGVYLLYVTRAAE